MEILSYLMHWTDHPVGQLHLGVAYLGLILGPVIFLRRKGTIPHRVMGYVFAFSMLTLNLSALTRYGLTGGPNFFHFAALVSLATIIPGLLYAWRSRARVSPRSHVAHGIFMTWAYFGLVMAFIAEAVTRQFPFLLNGEGAWGRFFAFLIPVMVAAAWWTNRMVRHHVIRRT